MENHLRDENLPLILTLASLKSPPTPLPLNLPDVGLFGSLNASTSTGNALADVWISMHEKPPLFPMPLPDTDDNFIKQWLHPNVNLPTALLDLSRTYAPAWEATAPGVPSYLLEAFPDRADVLNALMELAIPRLCALLVHRCSGLDSSVRELDLRKLNIGDFKLFKLAHALRFNTSVRKLDLRDNNITAKMMLLFTQLVGTHNFDLLDITFDEGSKTLADKSKLNRNVGSLRKVKTDAIRAVLEISTPLHSEDEAKFYSTLVVPAVDKFLSINRSLAANLATKSESFELKCSSREYVVMKPVFQSLIVRLTHLTSLVIESLYPPPPLHYPPFQEHIEPHLRTLVRHEVDYVLPEVLGVLGSLQELRFFNMLKEYSYLAEEYPISYLSTVPECISKLTNLRILTMCNCGIENIPENRIGSLTNLEELELSSNYLTQLPDELRKLTNLKRLVVDTNRLSDVPESLQQLKALQTLHLDGNKMGSRSYTGLKLLVQYLKRLDDFKVLNQQGGCLLPPQESEFAGVGEMAVRERDRKAPTPEFLIWLRSNALESPVAAVAKPIAADTILRSGYMTKKGGMRRNWKKRFFELSNSSLKYFENSEHTIPKGTISVSAITRVSIAQHPIRGPLLEVHTPSRTYFIVGSSPSDTEQWKVAIISAVNSNKLPDQLRNTH